MECEAATALFDTISTKVKAIKLRAFHFIKYYDKNTVSRRRTKAQNKSFAFRNPHNSFYGFRLNTSHNQPAMAKTSRRRVQGPENDISIIDSDLSSLITKMKALNRKFVSTSPSNQSPDNRGTDKRQLILSKLTELEQDLFMLETENADNLANLHANPQNKNLNISTGPAKSNLMHKNSSRSVQNFSKTFIYKKG